MRPSDLGLNEGLKNRLRELNHPRALLVFDYDGTLAPIVDDPAKASLPPATAQLFARLCELYSCAVVTGRSRGELLPKVSRFSLVEVVGNHGIEWDTPTSEMEVCRWRVSQWDEYLRRELATYPDIIIENKIFSISLHYRRVRNDGDIRAAKLAAQRCPSAFVTEGKYVFNLVSEGAPDKGDALEKIHSRYAGPILFVGDDDNDESAFAKANALGGISVHVACGDSASCAHFQLEGQPSVDELLQTLIAQKDN